MAFNLASVAWRATALVLAMLPISSRAASAQAHLHDDDAALHAIIAAERARPQQAPLPRAKVLAQPQRKQGVLSPDGGQLVWLIERAGQRSVWMLDVTSSNATPRQLLPRTDAQELAFSRDGRWLLLPTPRQIFALAMQGQAGSGAIAELGERSHRRFLWVDSTQPAAVLLLESPTTHADDTDRWRLLRLEIGGKERVLHEDRFQIVDAALGADGSLAWLARSEDEMHVLYRFDGTHMQLVRRCEKLERCLLLGHAEQDGVWMNSSLDGDLSRLIRLDPAGTVHEQKSDPRGEADMASVVLDPVDGQPRFVGFLSTVASIFATRTRDQEPLATLRARFPDSWLRLEISHGKEERWLVHERSDAWAGERLWLYAPARDDLRELAMDNDFEFAGKPVPFPGTKPLARKHAVRWQASDGRSIHGFLTLPPGRDVAKAPMVVSVHGGPFNHTRPEFSNDAQFLASRGYVVFQPNFRGSTGHGREYLFAGGSDFGNGRVQADIVEGTRWLLRNGVGDPERVGIMGASFGGYSALLGATFAPQLYRVAIAAVPPADFGRVLREYVGAGQEMVPGVPMAATMRHLSLDPHDAALAQRLAEQSPIAHAADLHRPVLLLAGGEDERVPIRGVSHYTALLHTLGKDVSLFVDDEAAHSISDVRTRQAYYFLMETMLHAHLGGDAPDVPDAELRAWLRRNLRMAGKDLCMFAEGGCATASESQRGQ